MRHNDAAPIHSRVPSSDRSPVALALGVATLAASIALATTARPQSPPADPLVKEGATVSVAQHTWVIPDGDVGLVPNVGIITGSRGVLVIDPGLGRRNGETVLREVAKVAVGRTLFVASTHFHAEHTTGILAFPPSATYVNSNTQEAEYAAGGAQLIATFAKRSPATADLLAGATQRNANVTFDGAYRLDLGGVHVQFMEVGPAHTRGDTVFFVEEDRVLFSGDVVMNDSFVAAGAAASMRAWLAAFDRLDALKPAVVVPSHGAVGGASLIATCREFMEAIRTRAEELKVAGTSADDTAARVQKELQAKHPSWPRANGIAAAARSAYAEAP
jgi:glyoxylase-like metal-dependent hydrolase (beta-lactamase superfamily II)